MAKNQDTIPEFTLGKITSLPASPPASGTSVHLRLGTAKASLPDPVDCARENHSI